ncbi:MULTISPECIES: lamin tail domain-containing protein [Streptomyces]|uniref:lamin tail domain-containing protein n=1 Tax=Streptomyces TaxID=1883 RepID=UPI0013688374|nr:MULTISPECIES: lamin tail domain-containing protein [Streptomyces]MCX4719179.1 lamin tail domain-containing protein [Streptomyces virginiae]MYV73265.1 lamin tail domain-containing protein [Streptomyces sp. SID1046]
MSASLATRRAVTTVLATAALIGAAALPAAAHDDDRREHRGGQSSVVISDVQYGTAGRDRSARALNREWVEVKNTGRRSVNLRGFTLTDRQGNRYRFADFRLDGRSSVKVHTGQGRDTRHDVYQDRRHQIWDERDTATLRDNRGNVIDTETWGRRGPR